MGKFSGAVMKDVLKLEVGKLVIIYKEDSLIRSFKNIAYVMYYMNVPHQPLVVMGQDPSNVKFAFTSGIHIHMIDKSLIKSFDDLMEDNIRTLIFETTYKEIVDPPHISLDQLN